MDGMGCNGCARPPFKARCLLADSDGLLKELFCPHIYTQDLLNLVCNRK
jgi:hypothetical protein